MRIEECVGHRIRRLRQSKEMTLQALADRINARKSAEMSTWQRGTVSAFEQGTRAVTLSDLAQIALALEVPPASLLIIEPDEVTIGGPSAAGFVVDRDELQPAGSALSPGSPNEVVLLLSRGLHQFVIDLDLATDQSKVVRDEAVRHHARLSDLASTLEALSGMAMSERVSELRAQGAFNTSSAQEAED